MELEYIGIYKNISEFLSIASIAKGYSVALVSQYMQRSVVQIGVEANDVFGSFPSFLSIYKRVDYFEGVFGEIGGRVTGDLRGVQYLYQFFFFFTRNTE